MIWVAIHMVFTCIGLQSVLWDEAVKINGGDPDFHRRDLWEAVENCNKTGVCPQYELGNTIYYILASMQLLFVHIPCRWLTIMIEIVHDMIGVQVIPSGLAKVLEDLQIDILDATKLIPEEIVPVTPIGKMTLNRNQDNFFMENEQLALHPGNLPPGITLHAISSLSHLFFSMNQRTCTARYGL